MKTILLAAGFGTRLKPLTNRIPKCLVTIKGEPILGIWLEKLFKLKIKKVRKYKTEWSWAPFFHEVDIIFEGKIYASIGGQSDWLSCEILSKNGISKIKLNKFFRRKLEDSVESFCELVGLDVKSYGSIKIKNIIWN